MKASIVSALRYSFLLLIGIALLVLAFSGQDLNKLLIDLQKADYKWVIASLLAGFLANGIRAYRWRMMIASLGHGSPSLLNTFYAVLVGYLANLAFPRMGEVSRCGVINKTDGIPLIKLVGTVVAERIADLLMLCIITAVAILLQFGLLSALYTNLLLKLSGRWGDITILIFAFVLLILALIFFFIRVKKKRWGISAWIYKLFLEMKSGILSVKGLENKTGFLISTLLIWFLYWLSSYLCFFALSSTSGLGPLAGLSTLVFSSLAMIAPVQGGIGAFHWMVSEGLTLYGISKSEGLAYALLIHSAQTIIILITGALSLILLLMSSKKLNHD